MTLARLGKGCDSDDGAGLFSVIGVAFVCDEVDHLRVIVVDNPFRKAVQNGAAKFIDVSDSFSAVLRCVRLQSVRARSVVDVLIICPSKDKND